MEIPLFVQEVVYSIPLLYHLVLAFRGVHSGFASPASYHGNEPRYRARRDFSSLQTDGVFR